jgi:hypothetical protein
MWATFATPTWTTTTTSYFIPLHGVTDEAESAWFDPQRPQLYSTIDVLDSAADLRVFNFGEAAGHIAEVYRTFEPISAVVSPVRELTDLYAPIIQAAKGMAPHEPFVSLFARMPVFQFFQRAPQVQTLSTFSYVAPLRVAVPARVDDPAPAFDAPFQHYLDEMTAPDGRFSSAHIRSVRRVWSQIVQCFGGALALPIAMPTADGALQLAWTRNRRHASIDIYEDRWDWFFRDRATGECDGDEVAAFDALPQALADRLALLSRDAD